MGQFSRALDVRYFSQINGCGDTRSGPSMDVTTEHLKKKRNDKVKEKKTLTKGGEVIFLFLLFFTRAPLKGSRECRY